MTQNSATPERILDIAIGFMGSKQLFAAARIGLFRALADGPLTLAALAEATGHPGRQVRHLADSATAQGLLVRGDSDYTLAEDARAYLSGEGEIDLTPFLAFLNDISYKQWLGYDATVDSDAPGVLDLDEAGWGDFMAGVMTYNALHAQQLGSLFDFAPYTSALDFGGFTPLFALAGMAKNPGLRTTFVVDPELTESTRAAADAAGVGERTEVVTGRATEATPEGSHDLVLVNHVLHRFTPDENQQILGAVRGAAADGATLMLLDFYLEPSGEQRKIDALHAGEYYNIDGTQVYPRVDVEAWLRGAGWEPTGALDLPGSPRLILARAV